MADYEAILKLRCERLDRDVTRLANVFNRLGAQINQLQAKRQEVGVELKKLSDQLDGYREVLAEAGEKAPLGETPPAEPSNPVEGEAPVE